MHEQLASSYKLHNEENLLVCLENILHAHKEWVISLKKDFLLEQCAFNLIIVDNDILTQRLHGVDLSVLNFLHQEYFAETTFSNDRSNLEISEINVFIISTFGVHAGTYRVLYLIIKLINLIVVIIVVLRGSTIFVLGSACRLVVDVFLVQSVFLLGVNFYAISDVFLRRGIILQFVWYSVNREIRLVLYVINPLESVKNFFAEVTLKLVVVLAPNMHNKLGVI